MVAKTSLKDGDDWHKHEFFTVVEPSEMDVKSEKKKCYVAWRGSL
jgi:hypothetical protein